MYMNSSIRNLQLTSHFVMGNKGEMNEILNRLRRSANLHLRLCPTVQSCEQVNELRMHKWCSEILSMVSCFFT